MSLCLNYSSSSYSQYLVYIGLISVLLGIVGFVIMIVGMNRAIGSSQPDETKGVNDLDLPERSRIGEGMDRVRLDDPTAKI
jgi:hypothetical protein